jgi:uncharacterized protein
MSAIIQGFRDGLAAGDLPIQHCNSCGKLNLYPRYACPDCQSDDLDWQNAAGTGTLMSFTILRAGAPEGFEGELPYALGVVRLEEGVQLLARLTPDADGGWASYACDAPVAHVAATDKTYAVFGHPQ